jgi:MSHA biogenesis protein MshN
VSVINKMLRDLDARQGAESGATNPMPSRQNGLAGTVTVRASASSASGTQSSLFARWLLPALLILATVGALAWYGSQSGLTFNETSQPVVVAQAVSVQPTPAAPLPVSAPVNASPESPLPDKPLVLDSPLPLPMVADVLAVAPEPAKPPVTKSNRTANTNNAPIQLLLRLESALRTVPAKVESMPSAVPSSGRMVAAHAQLPQVVSASAAPTSERLVGSAPSALHLRQVAVQETLVQAQSLWASGAHSAALDLMREAVAVSERAQSGLTAEAAAAALAPLVRELVRMELAEGRVGPALEVLTRLEPTLSGQADLWAVRGNAAQRLARHSESVRAYQMALKLRPGEPRWMLGAAVSMAAQGQLAEAAELVETARAIGTVSPDILSYLRQAGVHLR